MAISRCRNSEKTTDNPSPGVGGRGKKEAYEQLLTQLIQSIEQETGYEAIREFRFHGTRKWRFDVAWPQVGIALEIDGAVWAGGRHVHPVGFLKDVEKLNEANLLHWNVFRTTWKEMKNGEALALMLKALRGAHAS